MQYTDTEQFTQQIIPRQTKIYIYKGQLNGTIREKESQS